MYILKIRDAAAHQSGLKANPIGILFVAEVVNSSSFPSLTSEQHIAMVKFFSDSEREKKAHLTNL